MEPQNRVILHCDCNSFFASVECLYHPEYRDVPMAVCGDPDSRRGVILAKNELAKSYKIKTAETVWQAKQKCPQLVLAAPHHDLYALYSEQINEIYQRYTDLVEPFSIDESWLDVTGSQQLFGDGKTIADELRETVKKETGLTISVGVSFNKVFAKMGSDFKKPDATTVISKENFRQILWPMPVATLLYVGKSTEVQLKKHGIRTIGDLAGSNPVFLKRWLGKLGEELYRFANGLDTSPVVSGEREIKSIGNNITFRRDLSGMEDIRLGIAALADSVAARLRKHGVKCTTVQLVIKDPNLKSISRQKALAQPTFLAKELAQAAVELILSSWEVHQPIRMLSLSATGLLSADEEIEQLSLLKQTNLFAREREEKLERAMDQIREKYGKASITSAGLLHNDIGINLKKQKKADPFRGERQK